MRHAQYYALLTACAMVLFFPARVLAIEDPTNYPNSKFGVHILFPSELETAAKLVNSNGGDWGYVTIPIQSLDRNLEKWQKFMDECWRLHIIPIIRIATYPESNFWTRPTIFDHLDFANFLNSLSWPTKNRYIIVYNEPNSNLEWGGAVDASAYAQELDHTINAFKRVNQDFFIISAGLDSHAPNRGDAYKSSYQFLLEMDRAVPGIFGRIDGFASHSYPNKDFSENPAHTQRGGIVAYREETAFLTRRFGRDDVPIFITETGWQLSKVSEEEAALFYQYAFQNIWREANIVAITPFLLNGHGSDFGGFSLVRTDGSPSKIFETIASFPKVKGQPTLVHEEKRTIQKYTPLYFKYFQDRDPQVPPALTISQPLRALLKWFLYPELQQ